MVLLTGGLLASATAAQAQAPDLGLLSPFSGKNVYAPYLPYLSMGGVPMAPIRSGTVAVTTRHSYLNEFRPFLSGVSDESLPQTERIALDYESYVVEFSAAVDLGDSVQVGMAVRYIAYFGGFLDGVIEGFHHLFGLPNLWRERFERGAVLINMTRANGFGYSLGGPVFGLGDTDLWLVGEYSFGGDSTIKPILAVQLPTGDPAAFTGSGAFDLGAGVAAGTLIGDRFGLSALAAVILPGSAGDQDRGFPRPMAQLTLAAGWQVLDELAALAQIRFATSPFHLEESYPHPFFGDLPMFALPQTNLLVGGRWKTGPGTLSFYVEEDLLTWEGADIAFVASYSVEIRP
jgi:hypothetical protein